MNLVSLQTDGAVATITMQDSRRRNALGEQMLAGLSAAFDRLGEEVRAVILRAAADAPVWCAGFDIGALAPGFDPLAPAGALQGLFRRVHGCPAPVIGMLHGSAWGGGTDLALRCDLLIGDPSASLAFTPGKLGLPYDEDGLRNALWRAGPALAMEMFATAEPIGAERALASGLINRLVPAAELEAATYEMARRIAENAPLTVRSAKSHLRALVGGRAREAEVERALAASRAAALQSADYEEGLAAFRAKRRPEFRGA